MQKAHFHIISNRQLGDDYAFASLPQGITAIFINFKMHRWGFDAS